MEPLGQTSVLPIQDISQVALARRAATEVGRVACFDEQRLSALSIVVVELANNLLQHADGGQIYLRYQARSGAVDVAAVDHGRGMVNIDRCLEDGYSTASTPGVGLGAVRRFARRFAAYSLLDRTTVVAARMSETMAQPDFSVICTAIPGEKVSGDCWSVSEDGRSFLVVDGLGHGVLASEAARTAVEIFLKYQMLPPSSLMEKMHAALRSTRGAAAAVARIDPAKRILDFAGIGNIVSSLLAEGRSQSLVSHNGTLGYQMRKVQQFSYAYQPGDVLVMQSDGLTTASKRGVAPGLLQQPPMVIAPFLYAEQLRGRDDATVLVTRFD